VVVSFSILADMVSEIGGDAIDIITLVGANADAHVFEPSPSDAAAVARSDLVVINGLYFEGWIPRLVSASGYKGHIVAASHGVNVLMAGKSVDPHAWQDLDNAVIYVGNIRVALAKTFPQFAEEFDARAGQYTRRIRRLQKEIEFRMGEIPQDRRRIITSHDAFGYFGRAYRISFVSPQGWNTESEPSAADVARIIDQIRSHGANALFIENITNPRLIRQMAAETHATIGGILYSDALSLPGTEADTYLKLFDHNASVINAALRQTTRSVSNHVDNASKQ